MFYPLSIVSLSLLTDLCPPLSLLYPLIILMKMKEERKDTLNPKTHITVQLGYLLDNYLSVL